MSEQNGSPQQDEAQTTRAFGPTGTVVLCLVIAVVAALLIVFIYSSEPTAQRETAVRETAMLVDVMPVTKGTFVPQVSGLGTVVPAQEILLSPRVPGTVSHLSPRFVPGGFVKQGETLLSLDPADYQNAVRQRESELLQAESALAQERGRVDVAERDYEVLGKDIQGKNPSLALREPQLAAAEAEVASAQTDLDQAKLNLARTKITAPFDAHILTREANVGSEVSPGSTLARIVGIKDYHVEVSVPMTALRQLRFPEDGEAGAEVMLQDRAAWPEGQMRTGHVMGLIGAIDSQTRLARILVRVRDPLARYEEKGSPKLIVGALLQARIEGAPLNGVVKVNRLYLRQDDTVWVMQAGKLNVRQVTVAFRDSAFAYVSNGLNDGDLVVTSDLATVVEGAALRTESADVSAGADR